MSWIADLRANHTYRKVRKRIGRVDAASSVTWAASTIWSTQQALEEYSKTGDPAALLLVQEGAIALQAVADELLDKAP